MKTHSTQTTTAEDLLVFSHLRWNFVFQRPQHLMSRFAQNRRVYFIEEPIRENVQFARLEIRAEAHGLKIVVPHIPNDLPWSNVIEEQKRMVSELIFREQIRHFVSWYYTPMALPFTRHLHPKAIAYDCMDELSAFRGAPPELVELEKELLSQADVVFTGGQSLYEAKKFHHPNIHPFPSSIDCSHFGKAREKCVEPADQKIPFLKAQSKKVGFCGVIDERMDLELIESLAALRPNWNIMMIGPVVKIDPASLPQAPNIHYMGMKSYSELPAYMAHWDLAILPFARNESTRFISPTKTPEYLSAGLPVVSTSITDVVTPYGDLRLVHIADKASDFVRAGEVAMHERKEENWAVRVDEYLANFSWNITMSEMDQHLAEVTRTETKIAFPDLKMPWVKPSVSVPYGSSLRT